MKKLFLALVLLGCQDISSGTVVKIISADGGNCTGFFVESGDIQTSSHCVDSVGEEVEVTYKTESGYNDTINGIVTVDEPGKVGKALIDVDLDGPWAPWCEAHVTYKVKVWAWTSDEPQKKETFVWTHTGNEYTLTGHGYPGWSGGPVVWDKCIIGTYHGRTSADTGYVKLNK